MLCVTQVDLTLNIVERKTGGLSCGGGISSQGHSEGALPGFIGSASFSQRNLFGLNQKLAATLEIGQVSSGDLQVTIACEAIGCGGIPLLLLFHNLNTYGSAGGWPLQDKSHRPLGEG